MTVLQASRFLAQVARAAASGLGPGVRCLLIRKVRGMSTKNGKFRSSGWFGKPDRDGFCIAAG